MQLPSPSPLPTAEDNHLLYGWWRTRICRLFWHRCCYCGRRFSFYSPRYQSACVNTLSKRRLWPIAFLGVVMHRQALWRVEYVHQMGVTSASRSGAASSAETLRARAYRQTWDSVRVGTCRGFRWSILVGCRFFAPEPVLGVDPLAVGVFVRTQEGRAVHGQVIANTVSP